MTTWASVVTTSTKTNNEGSSDGVGRPTHLVSSIDGNIAHGLAEKHFGQSGGVADILGELSVWNGLVSTHLDGIDAFLGRIGASDAGAHVVHDDRSGTAIDEDSRCITAGQDIGFMVGKVGWMAKDGNGEEMKPC